MSKDTPQPRSDPRRRTPERRPPAHRRPPNRDISGPRPGGHLPLSCQTPKLPPSGPHSHARVRLVRGLAAGTSRPAASGVSEHRDQTQNPVITSVSTRMSTLGHARRAGKPLARPVPRGSLGQMPPPKPAAIPLASDAHPSPLDRGSGAIRGRRGRPR